VLFSLTLTSAERFDYNVRRPHQEYGVASVQVSERYLASPNVNLYEPPTQQAPIVTKRFYIHSAPEDTDEGIIEKHITLGKPRKNFNVVFIKSPTNSGRKKVLKIKPSINEEKTVIYYLSKKQDENDIQTYVQEPPATISRPEVYFIKYKTPEEAAHAQKTIQSHYDYLGGSTEINYETSGPLSSVIGLSRNAYLPPGRI